MIYNQIVKNCSKEKQLAVLIDPDRINGEKIQYLSKIADKGLIDFFLVGGSIVSEPLEPVVKMFKEFTEVPVILFPGSVLQVTPLADAIFFLSLISGRNPEYLIGNHVTIAPFLKKSGIEVISTGYILVENGKTTSVEYISNSRPIPADKPDIILATAIAGEMLGHKLIYLEAGSGAVNSANVSTIQLLKKNLTVPLIVGGGIRTVQNAVELCNAGADILVLGSVMENEPDIMVEMCEKIKAFK
jgi:phosphoglycerol geranylgeranyltransferase